MSDLTEKAKVAPVQLTYYLVIEGLLLPDGTYAIAYPQIAEMVITGDEKKDGFRTNKNYFSQTINRLCGKGFNPHKTRTELGKQAINVVTLEEFEVILAKLDRAGNLQAQHIRDELTGLGLHQSFADGFGIELDRKAYLTQRKEHKTQFQPHFTDWLKEDGVKGKQYAIEVNVFKRNAGCPPKPIADYTPEELRKLNTAEGQYHILREIGMDHQDASTKIAQSYVPVGDLDLNF